jgi:hypothetical protein
VVENWKAKNPNLKRLELATFVRSPEAHFLAAETPRASSSLPGLVPAA